MLAGFIDIMMVAAIGILVPLPPEWRLVVGTGSAVLITMLQAVTGASPGQVLTMVRLRRAVRPTQAPGRAALGRAALFVLAALPTFGILPLVMVAGVDDGGWRRTWYDRMAGTVVVAKERGKNPVQLVTASGRMVKVTEASVLGRAPDPVPGGADRLLPAFHDDPSVSRTHALVEPLREGIRVTDLNSTNGTHAEDADGIHRLAPGQAMTVERGRRVYFGDTECLVR